MVRYDSNLIDEIKANTNIVEIVSQYVALKRKGTSYFGLCPFHNEKSPSFSVSENKQIFHCFGCGAGGDVIGFLKRIENIDFKTAVEMLAEKANITLPTIETSVDERKKLELKEKVFKVNEFTANFYHENLYKPTAKPAQDYVKKRRLDNNALTNFQIGYSGNFDELYKALKANGFQDEEIFESKLVLKGKNGTPYDAFRKRLMFPIRDVKDNVIAFGGRVLDDSKPKYYNSPDTICFNKGRNLYALNIAKKTKKDYFIMVEGYMDTVSLHQRGIDNAIASLGTALTDNQARLLKRYKSKIIIGYDADGAGQDATMRGLKILYKMGYDIRILQIEGAKDPDEFVTKYGSGKFNIYVQNAISLVEFQVKKLKEKLDLNQVGDKIIFLNEVSKILLDVNSEIEKDVYIDKIASQYGVSKEALYAQVNKLAFSNSAGARVLERNVSVQPVEIKKNKESTDANSAKENLLISILINNGHDVYEKIKDDISPEDFKNEKNKKIVKILYEEFEKGDISNVIGLFENDEELVSHITYIMSKELDISDVDKAIDDLKNKFLKEKLLEEKSEILKKIVSGNLSNEETIQIENRLKDISKKLVNFK